MQLPNDEIEWRWCLVGNIVKEHPFGEERVMRTGTKHFRPGAKVYCAPINWGDGYESIVVIGAPRHGREYIEVVMDRKLIENFRIQKCFKPAVLEIMKKENHKWWSNSDEDRNLILNYYVKWLNRDTGE